MMHSILNSAYSPIGLEITPWTIAAAQLRRTRSGRSLWATLRTRRVAMEGGPKLAAGDPPTHAELARVVAALRRRGFHGRDVVACLPDSRTLSAVLELPPTGSGAPLQQLAAAELARLNKREPGALEAQIWHIPAPLRANATVATHVMAVGCESRDACSLAGAMTQAGLELAAIDTRSWALARAGSRAVLAPAGQTLMMLIVDVSDHGVLLGVVEVTTPVGAAGATHRVIYERFVAEAGLMTLIARVKEPVGLDETQADCLIRGAGLRPGADWEPFMTSDYKAIVREHAELIAVELSSAASYVSLRYPQQVDRVLLTGSGVLVPGLAEAIEQRASLTPGQAIIGTPADMRELHAGADPAAASDPAILAAIGLAMHPMEAAA